MVAPISGGSEMTSTPKSWVRNIEKETGKWVIGINIEVDGELIISPVSEDKGGETE